MKEPWNEEIPVHPAHRLPTRPVNVGEVWMGGSNPVRIQSMISCSTMETEKAINEIVALWKAGSEIVRLTTPTLKEAENLSHIRAGLKEEKCPVPLVADVHFLPAVAMKAVEYVEKVRINPGNFVESKSSQAEYTQQEYNDELEKIHTAVKPLLLRANELGRAIRIGVNHGSLSRRILERHGNTSRGMVQSAMEFIKIFEDIGFRNTVVSLKSSHPGLMIEAYRLFAIRSIEAGHSYPIHLGVTEAGDGEDGRIRSAMGIGRLLSDGIGDTVRVSLTEESVHEIPVARDIIHMSALATAPDSRNPLEWIPYFTRLLCETNRELLCKDLPGGKEEEKHHEEVLQLHPEIANTIIDHSNLPPLSRAIEERKASLLRVSPVGETLLSPANLMGNEEIIKFNEETVDGLVFPFSSELSDNQIEQNLALLREIGGSEISTPEVSNRSYRWPAIIPEIDHSRFQSLDIRVQSQALFSAAEQDTPLSIALTIGEGKELQRILKEHKHTDAYPCALWLSIKTNPEDTDRQELFQFIEEIASLHTVQLVYFQRTNMVPDDNSECLLRWMDLTYREKRAPAPMIACYSGRTGEELFYRASIYGGGLLLDHFGAGLMLESRSPVKDAALISTVLQCARVRFQRADYISCPSCGRTHFQILDVLEKIKKRTMHLKGVKIGVMGCIVNGPGEMADADFGYVGSGPGLIDLYVGHRRVKRNIPEANAVEELVTLIQASGQWMDP